MKEELEYIKANGVTYRPQKAGVQNPEMIKGVLYPVMYIKKLMFGRWQIDYYDAALYAYSDRNDAYNNQIPASRIILYPSGIEEIKYKL